MPPSASRFLTEEEPVQPADQLDTTDLLAAQALLQLGTAMLTEACKEQDSLQQITQPSKKNRK